MTKEQITLIKEAKSEILALAKTQDEIFNNLLKALGIAENKATRESAIDWLFDTVYNTGDSQEEFDRHIGAVKQAMAS